MSLSYIITNDEELKQLEELGTLKNEVEKQKLIKRKGKQDQDFLLEKQFKPITKELKEFQTNRLSPQQKLEAAQKEVEELEEQEIKNVLKRDSDYYNLSEPIKDLIENLLISPTFS